MQLSKILLTETTRPRAFIFGIKHHLEVLYQRYSNYAPGVKIDPAPGVTILHWIIYGKLQTTSSLEPLMGIWPNSTEMVPGWSLTEIVQMVLIGCIRSWVQFSKIFLTETTRPRAFIFGIKHHLEVLYQSCSNDPPGVKIDPAPGVTILHWIM